MNQLVTPLFDALKKYNRDNIVPFDVPGHKHGKGLEEFGDFFGSKILEVDVNSMARLDNLSNPCGVIYEAEKLLALAYDGDEGFFLVNGTSAGVRGMIMSACKPGDKIILPRNAHKSAINGLIMSGARPVYIQPEYDNDLGLFHGVSLEKTINIIRENKDAKAIFLINPTYFGATSDIKNITKEAHKYGMAVIVDEAHGAHLHFHDELPISAMAAGADITAVSIHKTGGSLTQSSALVLKNNNIDKKYIRAILNLNQTTSASYLLMSSIDVARRNLAVKGKEMLTKVLAISRYARDEINEIPGFYAFGKEIEGRNGVFKFDETKLVINTKKIGITGFKLYDILRDDYKIQMELGDTFNVLGIISLGDTYEAIDKLIFALRDISKKYEHFHKNVVDMTSTWNLKLVMSPRDAFYAEKERCLLEDSAGKISGESIMAYPPGIPVIAYGELITKEVIDYILFLKSEETKLTDMEDERLEYINIIKK